jgi:hypothetical protein
LPALLGFFIVVWAFPNLLFLDPVRDLSAKEAKLSDLTYVGLFIWIVAILLMTSNYLLYRLLEGYLPPFSWLIFGLQHHRRRFMRLKSRYDALMEQWESAAKTGKDFPIAKQTEATRLRRTLVTYYPSTKKDIMPTRFGNAIRSFEV